jgi:hypothetical protein
LPTKPVPFSTATLAMAAVGIASAAIAAPMMMSLRITSSDICGQSR